MSIRNLIGLVLVLTFALRVDARVTPRHVNPAAMNKNTREVFQESMALDAMFYDDNLKLVRSPYSRPGSARTGYHMVRESSWYALGLLLRDEPGDRQRAADIIDAVLKQQYLTPGTPWYGTFKRAPEEPGPAPMPSCGGTSIPIGGCLSAPRLKSF